MHISIFSHLGPSFPTSVFFVATNQTSRATDAIATKSFVGVDELRTHGTKSLWAWRSGIASFTVVVAFVAAIIGTNGEVIRARFVIFSVERQIAAFARVYTVRRGTLFRVCHRQNGHERRRYCCCHENDREETEYPNRRRDGQSNERATNGAIATRCSRACTRFA